MIGLVSVSKKKSRTILYIKNFERWPIPLFPSITTKIAIYYCVLRWQHGNAGCGFLLKGQTQEHQKKNVNDYVDIKNLHFKVDIDSPPNLRRHLNETSPAFVKLMF